MYTCHLYIEKGTFSNFTSTVTIEKVSGSAPCSPCLIAGSVCCLPLCFVANGMGNCPVRSARYKRQARTLHIESTVWWPDCKILYIVIVALFGHWIVAFSTPAIWIDAHQPVEVRRMAIRTFWMVIHFSAASIERNEVSTTASIVSLIASKEIEKKRKSIGEDVTEQEAFHVNAKTLRHRESYAFMRGHHPTSNNFGSIRQAVGRDAGRKRVCPAPVVWLIMVICEEREKEREKTNNPTTCWHVLLL